MIKVIVNLDLKFHPISNVFRMRVIKNKEILSYKLSSICIVIILKTF